MKSGASDPFGDSDGEGSEPPEQSSGERSESAERRAAGPRDDAEADPAEGETDAEDGTGVTEGDGPPSREDLPLVLRRERVKDERPEVHQLFVQQETHDRAVDAERALEDRLGVDLSRTDAREAIYLAGMAHLDDAEEILRTWGYDL